MAKDHRRYLSKAELEIAHREGWTDSGNPVAHQCRCGYVWQHGFNGSHLCEGYLYKRIEELEAKLNKLKASLQDFVEDI